MTDSHDLPPDIDPGYFMEPQADTREAFAQTVSLLPRPLITTYTRYAEATIHQNEEEVNAINAMVHTDNVYFSDGRAPTGSEEFYITVVSEGEVYRSSSVDEAIRGRDDANVVMERAAVRSLVDSMLAGRTDRQARWIRRVNYAIDASQPKRIADAEALVADCPGRTDRKQSRSGLYHFRDGSIIDTTMELPYAVKGEVTPLDSLSLTIGYRRQDGKRYTYVREYPDSVEIIMVTDGTSSLTPEPLPGEEPWQTFVRGISTYIAGQAAAISRGVDSLTDGKMREMTAGMQAALRSGLAASGGSDSA